MREVLPATGDHVAQELLPTSIPATLLDGVAAAGRDRGWRPNHILLAALAVAWRRVIGHEPTCPSTSGWLVGVNCRRPLGASRGVGNLSGFEPVALTDIEGRSLPDLVDDLRDAFLPLRRLGAGMVGEIGAPLLDFAPPRLLHQAMELAFETRAGMSRSTRIYSAIDIPESLGDWGDTQARAAWCEPARRASPPYLALVVTRFRGAIAITPIASTEVLSAGEADALIAETRDQVTELSALLASGRV